MGEYKKCSEKAWRKNICMFQRCRRNWRQFDHIKYDPSNIAKVSKTQNNQLDLKSICLFFLFVLVPPFFVYLPFAFTSQPSLQSYLPSKYSIIVPSCMLKIRGEDRMFKSCFQELVLWDSCVLIRLYYHCFFTA